MKKIISGLAALGFLAALLAGPLRADDEAAEPPAEPAAEEPAEASAAAIDEEGPEFILFENTGKLAPVKFSHRAHQENEKVGGCKACHEGEKPLFAQKRSEEVLLMKDMYAGMTCGACHDGKKAFAAKTGCMKCHVKAK